MRLSLFVIVRASFKAHFVAFMLILRIPQLHLNLASLDWVLNTIYRLKSRLRAIKKRFYVRVLKIREYSGGYHEYVVFGISYIVKPTKISKDFAMRVDLAVSGISRRRTSMITGRSRSYQ
jgi:hypothetical protein